MIVLDTTVLVYAKGAEHPLRGPCRRLVQAVTRGETAATTTAEAIQEFAHVRARRRGRDDAVSLAGDYIELLAPLLSVTAEDLRAGLQIYRGLEPLGAFDAVLAAAARTASSAVVSADRAFAGVPGLTYVFPDEAGIATLLSGAAPGPDR